MKILKSYKEKLDHLEEELQRIEEEERAVKQEFALSVLTMLSDLNLKFKHLSDRSMGEFVDKIFDGDWQRLEFIDIDYMLDVWEEVDELTGMSNHSCGNPDGLRIVIDPQEQNFFVYYYNDQCDVMYTDKMPLDLIKDKVLI